MIFWFSGTGNSKYAAQRMAEALNEPLLCMNDRIKAHDTAAVETGERLVIVTPTYAWRIPRLVRDWLLQTELRGARQAWFVMTCGGEIGSADRYNRELCRVKGLSCMGTAQIVMPENYIAMFGVPQADEARRIVAKAEPDRRPPGGPPLPADPEQPLRPPDERPGESALLFLLRQGSCLHRRPGLHRLRPMREALPDQQYFPAERQARLGRQLHPLHGLHLPLPRGGHRVRQEEPRQAALSF